MFILATSLSSQVNPDWRTYVMLAVYFFILLIIIFLYIYLYFYYIYLLLIFINLHNLSLVCLLNVTLL